MKQRIDRDFNGEPALADLLDDPVLHAMMARDGVEREALATLIGEVQLRLARPDYAGSSSVSQ